VSTAGEASEATSSFNLLTCFLAGLSGLSAWELGSLMLKKQHYTSSVYGNAVNVRKYALH
jgi:hypothetical protein